MWAFAALFCFFVVYFLLEMFRSPRGWVSQPLIPHVGYAPFYDSIAGDAEPSYEQLLAIEDAVGSARAGFGQEQIDVCLEVVPYEGDVVDGTESCAICLESLGEGGVVALPCRCSPFHRTCISRWLSVRASCPFCRCFFQ